VHQEGRASNEQGQLSIFLGISMLVVITFIAFIVNVGLFVKAKINLQNAVDAAAWSGAAVQARQLSNIGYLNWEMRNTYKEWMFKYYVLGQLSLNKTNLNTHEAQQTTPGLMSFRRNNFGRPGQSFFDPNTFDKYNSATICIAFGSESNICDTYRVPGLPRFSTLGDPGVSEHHEAGINQMISQKSKDCTDRSSLNASVANIWSYGTKNNAFAGAAQIAAHRVGAWPQAMELAFRMRNLEMILNRPPVDQPICLEGENCKNVETLDAEGKAFSLNERPVKAFWSAFRNLDDELRATFKLSEIAMAPKQTDSTALSGYLIPQGAVYEGTSTKVTSKHYIDLIPMPINLVTFFQSFTTQTKAASEQGSIGNVDQEGDCVGTKTGIPIPGHIMGFFKSPNILTYYPVKGEAKYVGLFYPFKDTDGITLQAYAAAKPYGGRIGPMLFSHTAKTIVPRKAILGGTNRSAPYISGFVPTSTASYTAGDPVPSNGDFWLNNNATIGGIPSGNVKFGVPNLLYDLVGNIRAQANFQDSYLSYTAATSHNGSKTVKEITGLHDREQFRAFAGNLPSGLGPGRALTVQETDDSIARARGPTSYEAINYLIPTCHNVQELDSVPVVRPLSGNDCENGGIVRYQLFAPLIGPGLLYPTAASLKGHVDQVMIANRPSIEKFLNTLRDLAISIVKQETTRQDGYIDAAQSFYGLVTPSGGGATYTLQGPQCDKSMASQFAQFFASAKTCDVKPLSIAIEEYISDANNTSADFSQYYTTTFVLPPAILNKGGAKALMTGYMPGPLQGATADGATKSPLGGAANQLSRRNFYSTKFIPLNGVVQSGSDPIDEVALYQENDNLSSIPFEGNTQMENKIPNGELAEFGSELFY